MFESLVKKIIRSKSERVDLKEIFCKPKGRELIKTIRTSAAGVALSNIDGSERQEALKKLKEGEKVRLIWDTNSPGKKSIVYLVRGGFRERLDMADCFGRLEDKIAGNVVRWISKDNILTSAKVVKIIGGTRKHPKLGCVLELSTYPGPEKKSD